MDSGLSKSTASSGRVELGSFEGRSRETTGSLLERQPNRTRGEVTPDEIPSHQNSDHDAMAEGNLPRGV
jgi:hypothetical protein